MVTAKKTSTPAADSAPKSKAPAKKTGTVKAPVPAAAPKATRKAATTPAVKKSPAKKAAPAKSGTASAAARPGVTLEQRHNYIEVAAFYVAQRRGFAPGNPKEDWAIAEVEVDQLILSGHFSK